MKNIPFTKPYALAMLCVAPLNLFTLFLPPFGFICGGMSIAVGLYWDKGAFMSLKEVLSFGNANRCLGWLFGRSCKWVLLVLYFIDGTFWKYGKSLH